MLKLIIQKFQRSETGRYCGLYRCECGQYRVVLNHNASKRPEMNCGCTKNLKHGHFTSHKGSRTYNSWSNMKSRCSNPNNENYKYWGARGIKVCERWLKFENFYTDMGDRPEETSLDRIDVNGNYEPGNCRWASKFTQSQNRRKDK